MFILQRALIMSTNLAETHSEDPATQIINVVLSAGVIGQTIQSTEGVALKLASISATAEKRSDEHRVGQVTNEIAAGNALNDATYNSTSGKASSEHQLHIGADAIAHDAGTKSAALSVSSKIQIAVTEVAQLKEIGKQEIAERTNEGVKAEMKLANAGSETESRKAASLDLESKLEASAKPTIGMKLG